jgi:hypothetical protein
VTLQVVRDWVLRFNAHGPEGLVDRKAPGRFCQGSRQRCRNEQFRRSIRAVAHSPILLRRARRTQGSFNTCYGGAKPDRTAEADGRIGGPLQHADRRRSPPRASSVIAASSACSGVGSSAMPDSIQAAAAWAARSSAGDGGPLPSPAAEPPPRRRRRGKCFAPVDKPHGIERPAPNPPSVASASATVPKMGLPDDLSKSYAKRAFRSWLRFGLPLKEGNEKENTQELPSEGC